MSEFDERISKAYDLIERYGRSESDIHYETGLDADDCFRDLMVYVKGLVARIAELEEFIGKLIEAGESEDSPMPAVWLELVNDWKEREG